MIRRALPCWMAIMLALASGAALAEDLVTSLSSDKVSIKSNFTGTEIVIFGQVTRDNNTISRRGNYDIAIIVEGPTQDITTRRKGRFLGVWVNRYYERFLGVPSFYAAASTSNINELAHRNLLDEYEIGLNHLNLAVSGKSDVPLSDRDDFRQAFLRLRTQQGLYSERAEAIHFLTDTMFRTNVPLPANIPVGAYKIKSYLFQDGVMLSETEEELSVAKTGFEQFTFEMSRSYSLVYGLIAVVLAILTGWLAGVIFKKD
ncbi:TIGR02186 family protein [Roseibium sediminis]|uniref:TIGR02186 family protein n=1 Tax=Roseibium sediminis TaxID=1775174 RepID=UPI00123D5E29|nr:TIGR02186 family protein [Roseibium sediminis]